MPAAAFGQEPDITVSNVYYDVSGATAGALKQDMHKNGPGGFAAYTRWHVSWTSDCKVALKITYTLPRLKNRNQVSLPLRRRWDRMLDNLRFHEAGHAENGISAAREILATGCQTPDIVTKKWMERDKAYDKATDHGKTQGAVLE